MVGDLSCMGMIGSGKGNGEVRGKQEVTAYLTKTVK